MAAKLLFHLKFQVKDVYRIEFRQNRGWIKSRIHFTVYSKKKFCKVSERNIKTDNKFDVGKPSKIDSIGS